MKRSNILLLPMILVAGTLICFLWGNPEKTDSTSKVSEHQTKPKVFEAGKESVETVSVDPAPAEEKLSPALTKTYTISEAIEKIEKDFPKAHDNKTVAFTEPPKKRLVKTASGAEIIELTYQNGGKLYLPNLPSYDPLEGTYIPAMTAEESE